MAMLRETTTAITGQTAAGN